LEEEAQHRNPILNYFAHGILFSVITIFMTIVWIFLLVVLFIAGALIGLIIGIIILFFIYGGINTFLMNEVWGILTKDDWKSLLFHGFTLFVMLLLVSIPQIVINVLMQNVAMAIILFVVYCFVDGYVARNVGGGWEKEAPETD
jgi:hypothetical protein